MTKTYIYNVAAHTFTDSVPFGAAWQAAKAKATELHTTITREVWKGDTLLRREGFATGGVFIGTCWIDADNYYQF